MQKKIKNFLKRFLPMPADMLNRKLTELGQYFAYQMQNLISNLQRPKLSTSAMQSGLNAYNNKLLLSLLFEQRELLKNLVPDSAPYSPKVSIIIPVYNAEPYLRQCLDCVSAQTLWDFELICIDDGSDDNSAGILKLYTKLDPRIKTVHQNKSNAGVARNTGIKEATGEYIIFLDADDFFEPQLLQHMYEHCIIFNADIAICTADYYNTTTDEYTPAAWMLKKNLLPVRRPFSWVDCPDVFFQLTTPCPWTKMIKRSFIINKGLEFQSIAWANDLYFVYSALALSNCIVVCDEILIHYRTNISTSLQSTANSSPLEFYKALSALQKKLREENLYSGLEQSFREMAYDSIRYNINNQAAPDTAAMIQKAFSTQYKEQFGIDRNIV